MGLVRTFRKEIAAFVRKVKCHGLDWKKIKGCGQKRPTGAHGCHVRNRPSSCPLLSRHVICLSTCPARPWYPEMAKSPPS